MLNAKLIIVAGDSKTTEVKVKFPCIMGRGKGSTLLLPHPLVSRQHCELFESNGQLMVRDLGSLNGTFVNSEKVEEAVVPPGQLLTVGSVTFRAEYDAPLDENLTGGRLTDVVYPNPAKSAAAIANSEAEASSQEFAFEALEAETGAGSELDAVAEQPVASKKVEAEELLDYEGISNTPLFAPEPVAAAPKPVAKAPMAVPKAPVAKPVAKQAAPPVAAPSPVPAPVHDLTEAEADDEDLNDFLNSLNK